VSWVAAFASWVAAFVSRVAAFVSRVAAFVSRVAAFVSKGGTFAFEVGTFAFFVGADLWLLGQRAIVLLHVLFERVGYVAGAAEEHSILVRVAELLAQHELERLQVVERLPS
jgi:hypothetical protein